jgi:hypothetical protein
VANTFVNLGFENAGPSAGLAEGWTVEQQVTPELLAEYGPTIPGSAIEDMEDGWTNEPFLEVFEGKLIDLFPALYNDSVDDEENFESQWQANEFFRTTINPEPAIYDSGTPEDVEDFEEEWDSNENNIAVFAGPELTAASYDSGTPQDFEDFEEEWNGNENLLLAFATEIGPIANEVGFTDTDPDTITRVAGDWVAEGYKPDQPVEVTSSINNDGNYTPAVVVPGTMTLIGSDSLVNQAPSAIGVKVSMLFTNQASFVPMAKGGRVQGALKRHPSGGPTGWVPFLFLCLQGPDIAGTAYMLGLSDASPAKIILRKGALDEGFPAETVDPAVNGVLALGTTSITEGDYVHLRMDVVVNLNDDVIINVFESDLDTNPVTAPVFAAIAGMDDLDPGSGRAFFDDALGVNSGSQPLTEGRGGFGFRVEDTARRSFFDHVEVGRQT